MDLIGAWKATMEAVTKGISLIWGDQTLAESSLQKRAEKAAANRQQAKDDLRKVNSDDVAAYHEALARLNAYDAECKRLQREAAAKRAG